MFTDTGNVVFAILAGVVGTVLALGGIFYAAAVFAAGMAGAVLFIHETEVNYYGARAGAVDARGVAVPPRSVRDLFRDRRVLIFIAAVVLFPAFVEDQERIFEQFERATDSDSKPGMGLGLWLVRRIVTAHGGTVTVDGAPGSGTTFSVVLPVGDRLTRDAGPGLPARSGEETVPR